MGRQGQLLDSGVQSRFWVRGVFGIRLYLPSAVWTERSRVTYTEPQFPAPPSENNHIYPRQVYVKTQAFGMLKLFFLVEKHRQINTHLVNEDFRPYGISYNPLTLTEFSKWEKKQNALWDHWL